MRSRRSGSPNEVITHRVGGKTDAMRLLPHRLVAELIVRVGRGSDPENIILSRSSIGHGRGVCPQDALKEISR